MNTVTPPRSLTRPGKVEPWCVLDATAPQPVFRCKHCLSEQLVDLPADLGMMKKSIDSFLFEHHFCAYGLKQLYAMRKTLRNKLQGDVHTSHAYVTWRRKLHRVVLAIARMKKSWPNGKNEPRMDTNGY